MNKALALLLPLALAAGCANTVTPEYDTRFGDAVREARMAQTINPRPAASSPQGIDGPAAHESMLRYQSSFRSPPPVVNVINVGTSGATGSGTGSASGTSSGTSR